ncbi:hypothetical protein [Microbacterium sp. E-13]|uniref:hypothetical protein n=1 Tax=Microbacterium sp. E-13 TaxID=3404048 RepID=UPI003CFB0DF9
MAGTPRPTDAGVDEKSGDHDKSGDDAVRGGMVKALLAVVVNVGVLTAMLVYFGWVRSERMSALLGIDEAILGMTVDDYVRRSVTSVVLIPLFAAAGGLAWVAFDQWRRQRRQRNGADDRVVGFAARWIWVVAIGVFLLGVALWMVGFAATFIAAPLVCTAGVLLFLYGLELRSELPGVAGFAPLTEGVLRGSVAILVAIGLFWTATNFATVEGTQLARDFPSRVGSLPSVEIDSETALDIVAPGIETSCLPSGDGVRYHYRGLRLLESTGGNYFLISDGWTRDYGVVVMLPADGEGTRFTFVRDRAGTQRDAFFPPCDESAGDAGGTGGTAGAG